MTAGVEAGVEALVEDELDFLCFETTTPTATPIVINPQRATRKPTTFFRVKEIERQDGPSSLLTIHFERLPLVGVLGFGYFSAADVPGGYVSSTRELFCVGE